MKALHHCSSISVSSCDEDCWEPQQPPGSHFWRFICSAPSHPRIQISHVIVTKEPLGTDRCASTGTMHIMSRSSIELGPYSSLIQYGFNFRAIGDEGMPHIFSSGHVPSRQFGWHACAPLVIGILHVEVVLIDLWIKIGPACMRTSGDRHPACRCCPHRLVD